MRINLNVPRLDSGKPLTAADFAWPDADGDARPIPGAGPVVWMLLLVPLAVAALAMLGS